MPWISQAARSVILLCGGGLLACSGIASPENSPADPAEDHPVTTSTASALPDLSGDLQSGLCEDGPGVVGADSYFIGDFTVTDQIVTGTERWILFTNDKWRERGGVDCELMWRIHGTVDSPGACTDCATGFQLKATPDVTGSACPEELIKKEAKDFETRYGVRVDSDGSAHFFYASSGKRLGQGYATEGRFNYVSNHSCRWF